ncbi:Lysine-specific demethylase 4B, partial [Phytophthora pseudosyringae]
MATRDRPLPGQIPHLDEIIEESPRPQSPTTSGSTSPAYRLIPSSKPPEPPASPRTQPMASRPPVPVGSTDGLSEDGVAQSEDTLNAAESPSTAPEPTATGSASSPSPSPSPHPPPSQQSQGQSQSPRTTSNRVRSPRQEADSHRTNSETVKPTEGSAAPLAQPYRRQTMARNNSGPRVAPRMSRQMGPSGSAAALPEGDAVSQQLETTANEEETGETDELTFTLPELSKEGDDTGRTVRETWPTDHVMLLYMLSRYAVCARTKEEKESWIRQIPLLVLMYEGIAAGALNFDYAPAAMVIAQEGRPKRIWMNTTQDGKSAIDDLREANLINGLKLSTKDYHSVTAFQVSLRGLQLLSQVSKEPKANVDAFIFAPKPYRRELLKIRYIPIRDPPDSSTASEANAPAWTFTKGSDKHLTAGASGEIQAAVEEEPDFNEEGRFILESIGYFRYSGVTETEDVSYVSSPFVPQCVRSLEAYQQLSSNAHRALEAASGQSNIRDTLSEAIVLANPVCLVGEWIPFGSNQIVALNERLGSMDRCQGG